MVGCGCKCSPGSISNVRCSRHHSATSGVLICSQKQILVAKSWQVLEGSQQWATLGNLQTQGCVCVNETLAPCSLVSPGMLTKVTALWLVSAEPSRLWGSPAWNLLSDR